MYLQITEISKAISENGIMVVLNAILFIAVYFLFRLFVKQSKSMRDDLYDQIKFNRESYTDLMKKQDESHAKEIDIVRQDLMGTKNELRDYKNNDKAMIANFVETISTDNKDMRQAITGLSISMKSLINQMKKH